MHVHVRLEIRLLSALRGLSIDARWTFSFILPPPYPPTPALPGEGLPGGLREGSCGGRRCISIPNRETVGELELLSLLS